MTHLIPFPAPHFCCPCWPGGGDSTVTPTPVRAHAWRTEEQKQWQVGLGRGGWGGGDLPLSAQGKGGVAEGGCKGDFKKSSCCGVCLPGWGDKLGAVPYSAGGFSCTLLYKLLDLPMLSSHSNAVKINSLIFVKHRCCCDEHHRKAEEEINNFIFWAGLE